ncbi:MFS transporter [Phytohabitans suffuscus]|uniref:MFS transporter n=1 Tax=Phytohabitans suffuscus TaxID=624315 RepID=A0A6F8YH05_9ACTN|nr:MFS transporter [Phytohabitans suffuscus]
MHQQRRLALLVVLLALFMDLLDNTIVNVALPVIRDDLGASSSSLQWVAAGYALSFALGLITGGRLGDIFGRKRIFLIGIAGFTVASALCGAAQTPGQLVAARVLQGIGAALMVPQVLSIIQVLFPPGERAKAMAAFGALAGIATVGGPIVGALLTEGDVAGLGWRSIFLINLPVGVFTLLAAALVVPESKAEHANRLDLPGTALVTLGLLLLIYPLVQGREMGPVWIWSSLAGSLVVLAVFVAYERRRVDSPLVVLALFRHRSFSGGLLVALLFFGGVFGYLLVFTVYLQAGQGYSVLRAGLAGIPWGAAVPVFAAISLAVFAPRLGRPVLQVGLVLMSVSMLWQMMLVGPGVTALSLAPALVVGGAGMGLILALLFDFTLADVPVQDAGSASGLGTTVQQVGTAIGIAAIGAAFFTGPTTSGLSVAFQRALWLPVGMFAAAFAASFLLPRKAQHREI